MAMLRRARSCRCLVDALRSRNGLSYTTASDQSWIKPYLSGSVFKDGHKYISFSIPGAGVRMTESDESLSIFANMPGVKKEDVEAYVEQSKYMLSIRGKKYEESYYGGKLPKVIYRALVDLPENVAKNTCAVKTEMPQDGLFEVTLPKLKDKPLKKTSFFTYICNALRFKLFVRCFSSIPSVTLTFARPSVIERLCPEMYDSFTIYKKETSKSFHISVMPGIQKTEHFEGGACISLSMPELSRIEDVKLYYKCGTLFIQGKTKTKTDKVQYITGIRLPEFYARKRSMIKEQLQDGMYKATIPLV